MKAAISISCVPKESDEDKGYADLIWPRDYLVAAGVRRRLAVQKQLSTLSSIDIPTRPMG
jgi:hypothetical protein